MMVSLEVKEQTPRNVKVKDLVLASYIHPWAAQDGYRGIVPNTYPNHSYFFTKTHTYIHPAVHRRPSPIKQRMDLVCKVSPMPWD